MVTITADMLAREKTVHQYIESHAALFELDPNLIRGLISHESRFIAEAVSPTGAYGFGQFTQIAARQVQNIADMTPAAADLKNFTKQEASDPDRGIKAICATLWWLFNRKYHQVTDKKVQLEAVLTFYNAGGRPAAMVVQYGGHNHALEALKGLPSNIRSQSVIYAPSVATWFVAWHEHMLTELPPEAPIVVPTPGPGPNPFDEPRMDPQYRVIIELLRIWEAKDSAVDVVVNTRDGLTEVTLIFPGELT